MSLKLTLKNVPHSYCCDRCSEVFKSALHLKYHKFRIHNRRRPYVCKDCRKSFRRINELQQHRRRHKADSKGFSCDVCQSAFSSRKLLSSHQAAHLHHEGDHECGYCCATFLQLAEARLHVLLVHADASILPPERVRKHEEVFSVKDGGGLKIKLQRKLSIDVDCGYNGTAEDLNPGSHTSDSGKGNSDMDEEELLRSGNHLLRTPTFVPRSLDHNSKPSHRVNMESGLLTKPKLEVGQTQWGSSKIQPTLTSKDFLTKTKFAAASHPQTINRWGGGGLGFASPSHGSVKSLSPANSACSGQEPAKGNFIQPNSPLTNSLLNSSSLLSQNKLPTGTVPQLNGAVKPPSGMFSSLSSGKFGSAPSGFGSTSSALLGTTGVGFGLSKPVFTTTKPSAGFGTTTFGTAKQFGIPSIIPVFSSKIPVVPRNGELLRQPVFGSKEKVRRMIAKAEEAQLNAFEQYAGSSSNGVSNPFADAMKKAKNPTPKRYADSEDSGSYFSGSEDETADSGVDGSSEEDQEISDIEDTNAPLPILTSQSATGTTDTIVPILSGAATALAATSTTNSYDTPLQWMSPTMIPSTLMSNLPPPIIPSPTKSADDLPSASPTKPEFKISSPTKPCRTPTRASSRTPSRTPAHRLSSPRVDKLSAVSMPESIEEEEVTGSQLSVNASSQYISPLSSPKHDIASKTAIDVAQTNGDITSLEEVTGIIDLDIPSMSLSIPKHLIEQARARPVKRRSRRASSSSRSLRMSSRTPTRSTSATPTYSGGARTPARTPAPYTEYSMPPTPVFNSEPKPEKSRCNSSEKLPPPQSVPTPPAKPVKKSKRAPTKQEMMERIKQHQAAQSKIAAKKQTKCKIGPKSYMKRVNGRVFSDAEDEKFLPSSSGRTDYNAPYASSFKQNEVYLCYLRKRSLDLIRSLFPDMRVGGNFCLESDDVEGLLDYVILALQNQDSSSRCINSVSSKRKQLNVTVCRSSKRTVKVLQQKLCRLIRLILPDLSLKKIEDEGINTLPKLIHKVITENT